MRTVKNGFVHYHETQEMLKRSITWHPAHAVGDDWDDSDEEPLEQLESQPSPDGLCDEAFQIRTPSTVCSSPQLPSRLRSPGRFASLAEPEPAAAARKRTKPLPFASLGLPAWAIELAANAPVDDDCDSWYSQSPCSSASSPRSFAGASVFVAPRSASPTPLLQTRQPGQGLGVSWADLMEEDDEDDSSDGWGLSPELGSERQPSVPPTPQAVAVESAGAREGRVCWADSVAEEERPDDVWMGDVDCQSGMLIDGDASTDASEHGGSRCSSVCTSPHLPALTRTAFLARGLCGQGQGRKSSWADLMEDEDDGICAAWPTLPAEAQQAAGYL